MQIPQTRITAREGVNAAQSLFEAAGCVFQEIAQQNDFGKDAYVDLGKGGSVTHLCIAIQMKSGPSFRSSSGDYFIPVESHASDWRKSTVPVFGLVFDPADKKIRWVDLTGYLRAHPEMDSGSVPVKAKALLDGDTIHKDLARAAAKYEGTESIGVLLLADSDRQAEAVFDAWALGRRDPRYLILLRRLILDLNGPALRHAIYALSHVGSHPDIFWTKDNWIPQNITEQVIPSFRWSPDELAHMIRAVDVQEWGRGTLGQSLDVLFYEDPDVVAKLHLAVGILLRRSESDWAVRAATVILAHSRKDAREQLAQIVRSHPELVDNEWFPAVSESVQQEGWFSLYD